MAAHRWWEALVFGSFGWTFFQWKMLHWSYLRWLLGLKNLVKISWWTSATCSSRSSTERTNYFDQVNVWNWQKQWQIHTSDTTSFETTQDKPALCGSCKTVLVKRKKFTACETKGVCLNWFFAIQMGGVSGSRKHENIGQKVDEKTASKLTQSMQWNGN